MNLYDPQIVFVRFGRDLLYFVRLLILDINDSLPALVQPTEQHELINNAGFVRAHDRRFDRFIQERITRRFDIIIPSKVWQILNLELGRL